MLSPGEKTMQTTKMCNGRQKELLQMHQPTEPNSRTEELDLPQGKKESQQMREASKEEQKNGILLHARCFEKNLQGSTYPTYP